MNREEMIRLLVTHLLVSRDDQSKLAKTQYILSKGVNAFSEEEIKKFVSEINFKDLEFLIICSELLASDLEDKIANQK